MVEEKMVYLENEELLAVVTQLNQDNQRFDHLGCIFQVWNKKTHTAYLSLEEDPDPFCNRGVGICDEFCASNPIGFQEAGFGEWFLKPGCGLLKKDNKAYHFRNLLEFLPVSIEWRNDDNTVEIECECMHGGYGCFYKKKYSLVKNELKVDYEMINIGEKTLIWQTYAHNFFSHRKSKPFGMKLLFEKMNIRAVNFCEGDEVFRYENHMGYMYKEPEKGTLYVTEMEGNVSDEYSYVICTSNNQMLIRERGNFRPVKFKLWINKNCFCPEVFGEFSLKSGESVKWHRIYEFF